MEYKMYQIYGKQEMVTLKPCPFCGGEGCLRAHNFYDYGNTYGVVCLDCGAETRQFYEDKKRAIEAWNWRVEDGKPN